uniref:Uncharacterized protein n=1 Tax=Gopherus agassizii TaxID=38772 RepID=A0A452I7R4_9SAUR
MGAQSIPDFCCPGTSGTSCGRCTVWRSVLILQPLTVIDLFRGKWLTSVWRPLSLKASSYLRNIFNARHLVVHHMPQKPLPPLYPQLTLQHQTVHLAPAVVGALSGGVY